MADVEVSKGLKSRESNQTLNRVPAQIKHFDARALFDVTDLRDEIG